jgi:hypothetical protein
LTVFSALRVVARFDQLSQAYASRQAGHIWDVHSDGFQFFVLMPLWFFFFLREFRRLEQSVWGWGLALFLLYS